MAKSSKKVVATLTKRDKKRPLAYVDRKGNVRHFRRGQKKGQHTVLAKNVVGKDVLSKRKKLQIILYIKGKRVMQAKSALRNRARKAKGGKAKGRGRRRRVGRPRLPARKRKSSRCPTTRKKGTIRAAKRCLMAGKGRTIASRKVYNQAMRRLRRSKAGRAWLRKRGLKRAKTGK